MRDKAAVLSVLLLLALLLGVRLHLPIALDFVAGSSMYPTASNGYMVLLVSARLSPPKVGDVVLYSGRHMLVLHRVVEVEGDTLLVKGDNNPHPDPPVPREKVLYKAVLFIPPTVWSALMALLIYALILLTHRSRLLFTSLLLVGLVMGASFALLARSEASYRVKPVHLTTPVYVDTPDADYVVLSIDVECVSGCVNLDGHTIMLTRDKAVMRVPGNMNVYVVVENWSEPHYSR